MTKLLMNKTGGNKCTLQYVQSYIGTSNLEDVAKKEILSVLLATRLEG